MSMSILMLLSAGLLSACASVLLRVAAQYSGHVVAGTGTLAWLLAWPSLLRLGALICYGGGFALYAVALRRIQLSMAYPLMVGTAVIALLVYDFVTHEGLSAKTAAGAALLMVGIALIYS